MECTEMMTTQTSPSTHSWQRGTKLPYFMKKPLYCPTPTFQILWTPAPLPCCLQLPPPLLILLSCFFGWMGDRTTFDVLFYLISWMHACRDLHLDACFVLCNMTSSFIVCIEVSTPLSKTLTPLFYQAPPQIYKCPSSAFFMKFPPIY